MAIETTLTRAWDLRHPIVGAPMGRVSHGALAGAVSAAGGLGFIGFTTEDADWIAHETGIARDGGGRFGAGFIGWILEHDPTVFDRVMASEPFAISLSFTDPRPWAERARAAGVQVVIQVQDRASLDVALEAEPDAVVIQGGDAGGHTGDSGVGTLPLVQALAPAAEAAGVPWLAAGGITTGRGIAGVLAMGAAGAWIGTVLRGTPEATQSEAMVGKLLAATEADTELTTEFDRAHGVPWPEHFPGRALRGAYDDPPVWASAGIVAVTDLRPAAEVVETLAAEAERALNRDGL